MRYGVPKNSTPDGFQKLVDYFDAT